jgi:hypothetical protein
MSVWTSPATPVALTTITVPFYTVNVRDNLNVLRANTGGGDPTAANQLVVADAAGVTTWHTMTDPTILTDKKVSAHSTGLASFAAAALTGENLLTSSGQSGGNVDGPVASDWHVIQTAWVGGNYWLQLAVSIYDVNSAYLRVIANNVAGPWVKWWHSGNDGSGSGLDADSLRGLVYGNSAGQIPVSNNVVCSQLVAESATTAGSATTAVSASQLGGVAASSYARKDAASNFTTPPTISGSAVWHAGNLTALDTTSTAQSIGVVKTITLSGGATMVLGRSGGRDVTVNGDFLATGLKTAAALGPDGLLHGFAATEATRMYFEDYGSALVEQGYRYFVDTEADYYVWLTPHGDGRVWIEDVSPDAFVIRATRDIRVDWRITALRKDRNQDRLEICGEVPVPSGEPESTDH